MKITLEKYLETSLKILLSIVIYISKLLRKTHLTNSIIQERARIFHHLEKTIQAINMKMKVRVKAKVIKRKCSSKKNYNFMMKTVSHRSSTMRMAMRFHSKKYNSLWCNSKNSRMKTTEMKWKKINNRRKMKAMDNKKKWRNKKWCNKKWCKNKWCKNNSD